MEKPIWVLEAWESIKGDFQSVLTGAVGISDKAIWFLGVCLLLLGLSIWTSSQRYQIVSDAQGVLVYVLDVRSGSIRTYQLQKAGSRFKDKSPSDLVLWQLDEAIRY